MPSHEAGWAHADGALKSPAWLREPTDTNRAGPEPVVADRPQGRRRPRGRRGAPARPGGRAHDAGVRPRRGRLPLAGPCLPRGLRRRTTSSTPARRSCAPPSRGWIAEEGLNLDVCSPGELTRRARRRLRPGAHRLPRQQQDLPRAAAGRRRRGRPDHRRLLHRDRPAGRDHPRHRRDRAGDGAGDGGRRGAHARVHRHRARGPEVRLLDHQRRRRRGGTPRGGRAPDGEVGSSCSACTPTSAARSSTPRASRWPPGGCSRCTTQVSEELGVTLPELDLGGGFGIAYTTQDDPSDPAQLATELTKIVEHECRALGIDAAAPVDRARPRDRRPVDVHPLHRRHGQGGRARRQRAAHLRLGRRRDERQHPHGALRRRLLLHARLAAQRRGADAGAGRRQALRGRRHRGEGRVPARRPAPGRPGRRPRHRRLLPLDGLQLQPRAAAAGDRGAGRGRDRAAAQGD